MRGYVHGLGSSSSAFDQVVRRSGPRSLLFDLAGFGSSDKPDDFDYSLESHAAAVAGALKQLGLEGVDLIGHSLGGSVALVLAERHPELVARLIVTEPNLDAWDGEASVVIAQQSEADFVDRGFDQFIADAPRSWATTLRQTTPIALHRTSTGLCVGSNPMMREILSGLEISRTLVRGEKGGEPADRAGLEQSGVAFRIITGAGHVMMDDNPAEFASAVDSILV
ncbi:MAG: alpha/beta hydrolase [Actinomycetota bacterium]|nr:alpha/beta hydrolase [Actinomycetota bacterium]